MIEVEKMRFKMNAKVQDWFKLKRIHLEPYFIPINTT